MIGGPHEPNMARTISFVWDQLGMPNDTIWILLGRMRAAFDTLHPSFQQFVMDHRDRTDDTVVRLGANGVYIEEIN